jgi:hypothetical protein
VDAHWHAYEYTGRKHTDGENRSGSVPASYPPFLISDWLRKPPRLIVDTFTDVDAAVSWIEATLQRYVPVDVAHFSVEARLGYSRRTLEQVVGGDEVYGYYTAGGEFISRALVKCPRARPDEPVTPPCPTAGVVPTR